MIDYNAQEMARMQKEAKARVLEMQNRSRFFAEQSHQTTKKESVRTKKETNNPQSESNNELFVKKEEHNSANKQDDELESLFLMCLYLLLKNEQSDAMLPFLILFLL